MDSHWPTPGREVNDCVYLKDLQVSAIVGPDAWGRQGQIQPVLISVKWYNHISSSDALHDTLNYSKMTKDITGSMKENYDSFTSAHALADYIYQVAVLGNWNGLALSVQVHLPKAVLHANKGLKYISHYQMKELESGRMAFTEDQLYPKTLIEDVKLLCIIGVNDHERLAKQSVRVNLVIEEDLTLFAESGIDGNWRGLVKQAAEVRQSF